MFIVKSLLLGIGLAMDAVAVSMANGLQNPKMKEDSFLYWLHLFPVQYSQSMYFFVNYRYSDVYLILCGHSCGKEIRYDLCGKGGCFGRSRPYYCGYSSIKI